MYYVYILQSNKSHKLYKGSTGNLRQRLKEHNSGQVMSTKYGTPWKLIYYAGFADKTDALREEKFLKTGKGRARIQFLLQNTWRGAPNGKAADC